MNERVEVRIHDSGVPRVVGELLDVGTGPHFQYATEFLRDGVELSPLNLARDARVFVPGPIGLYRLQGLFFDSLPDGWGLRLLHQSLRDSGVDVTSASVLTWLRALGTRAMGALTFHPALDTVESSTDPLPDLAALAAHARVFEASDVAELHPTLARTGGSSGGARPKIVVGCHDSGEIVDPFVPLPAGFRHRLIKFAARTDPADAPRIEAAYLSMARDAAIDVPAHRVVDLPDDRCALIVDRFDRVGEERRHVHSLAGLLSIDIRQDLVDYEIFLRIARLLTNDFRVVSAAWRRAVFNVAVNNRDDHARNIAFLMQPNGVWELAPAYDLTLSEGPGGYHTMSVAGESRSPGRADLLRLADRAGLARTEAERGLDEVRSVVSDWLRFADMFGLARARRQAVQSQLRTQSARLAPTAR